MVINKYKQIVADQQFEIHNLDLSLLCSRREEVSFELQSPLIQVVTGARRCGKSTICHKVLLQEGISYAYVNFDDERLTNIKTENFDILLEALYMVYGDFKYLFFDEIQNIKNWNLFVNRLFRQKIHIILTGSNAKLLSSELSTYLTGRYNQIELYPFSFSEYLQLRGINNNNATTKDIAFNKNAFEEYMQKGGFPELVNIKNYKGYMQHLVSNIITVDIKQRFKIRYIDALTKIADFIIANFAKEINYKYLSGLFGLGSDHTSENYVNYLKQAYLIVGLNKFSYKAKERIRAEKLYLIDPALFTSQDSNPSGENTGYLLENIVYLELLRRKRTNNTNIFYYKNSYEIDFVICKKQKVIELIQVSENIDTEKTYKREVTALLKASDVLRCDNLTLVTMRQSQHHNLNNKQIDEISIVDWLCY